MAHQADLQDATGARRLKGIGAWVGPKDVNMREERGRIAPSQALDGHKGQSADGLLLAGSIEDRVPDLASRFYLG